MGFQLTPFDFHSFETQLNQLASRIITSASQLHIWTNKLIEFRALQMDGLIDDDDELNDRIDMMEDYVNSGNLILQDMAQKVVYAKQIYQENQQATSMTIQQENFLEYYSTIMDKLLSHPPTV
ncbi:hypothetical protein PS15m_005488 [Mucor circinelloides]